ncbi:DinB family protein [Hymenobacter sp. 15J16-1T3B]|uniref:DinB family protein n=1 Tax=Hymenobacter sp. 15J16-1T3B TaxID=2886941 RepID=UPI001D0FCD1E|nr:DinB family protein [Hymenobacter sp. 15J16-1T3B]MCC3155950.1 DinB family protein [Hymenobacter sp. 15J16-1T3B]
MQPATFLQTLHAAVRRLQATTETELAPLPDAVLNFKPRPDSWSVLECLEHLNRYSRYYHPALAKALAKQGSAADEVRYSWLGRKSLDIVRPDNGQQHKTVKHMNPAGSQLSRAVLTEFLGHQAELLYLLTAARATDLNRRAVPVEFFRLLKLRVGETLEFVVRHQERHLQQAQRVARLAQATAPVLAV